MVALQMSESHFSLVFVWILTLFEELRGLERKWALCVKAFKYIIHLLLGLLKIVPHLPLIFHYFSRRQHWDEVVKHYYDVFNRTLAEFGLVLRHLGTSYNDFLYEVKRALRGQFLCVAVIIPIGKSKWILVFKLQWFQCISEFSEGKTRDYPITIWSTVHRIFLGLLSTVIRNIERVIFLKYKHQMYYIHMYVFVRILNKIENTWP